MKKLMSLGALFTIIGIFLLSCSPGEVNPSQAAESPAEITSESPPTNTDINQLNENGDLVLSASKATLLVYQGEARLSQDEGETWSEITTGQWLEAGDEVQLSEDGLALIVLPQLGIIRLEGNAEYLIDEYAYDAATGDIQYASQLFEGRVIFEINPLKTANSRFSLGLIKSLIQVRYDPAWKYQSGAGELVDPENSVIASGVITREGEVITGFRGPMEIYNLGLDEEQYFMVQYPTFTNLAKSITLEIPMPADLNIESDLEEFLPIADYLLNKYALDEKPVFEGYQIVGDGGLEDGGKVIFFNGENDNIESPTSEGADSNSEKEGQPDFLPDLTENLARSYYRSVVKKPELLFSRGLTSILADETNLGCDPFVGSGCALPEGCDQASGENCALATGCNPVTDQDCVAAGNESDAIYTEDGQLIMPNEDDSLLPMLGDEEDEKPTCFFSDPNWVCEQKSCWVCVAPDPAMGPPPEGWEPCHPACCCEPGARTTKP